MKILLVLVLLLEIYVQLNKGRVSLKLHIKQKQQQKQKQKSRYVKSSGLKKYTTQYDFSGKNKGGDDDDDDGAQSGGSPAPPVLSLADQMANLKSKVNPKAGIIDEHNDDENPHLIMEGGESIPADYQSLEATQECVIKQGYLGLVTQIRKKQNALAFPTLTAKSTFAVLNKNSLSFFDKEHVNSLVKVLDIVHLQPAYYPAAFGDLACFQLVGTHQIKQNLVSIVKKEMYLPENKVMATICAANKQQMEEWAEAIQTFHNCNVEVAHDDVVEQKTTIDVLKDNKVVLKRRVKEQMDLNALSEKEDDSAEVQEIQKQLEEIKKEIVKVKAQQAIEKREETIKLENDIRKASETIKEKECIDKVLDIQREQEEEAVEQMITKESEKKETITLEEKKKRILELLKKQGAQIHDQQKSIDETVQKMTDDMKYNMVQTVQQYQKVLDPTMCYFAEYGFPSDVKTKADRYKYVCTRMIDVSELDIEQINNCLIPSYFCDVCCDYNIGAAQEVKREECVNKCSNKVNVGAPNIFKLSYTIVPNNLKLAQLNQALQQQDIAIQNRALLNAQNEAKQQKAPLNVPTTQIPSNPKQ